ncbi:uncharacterized protein LOC126845531 [Adelges cooleyi]|uniref:uncharacterized protein LOC126845531 n=1 Tax=Adelges cooleyi TaxID=133065 RepID=UPI00217FB10C|nr:uncharacterized protein LOC126845531 [Adelges cooleyi]
MKIFLFLITLVLFNVSAYDEMNYKKEVFLTNVAIELAYNKNDFTVGDNSGLNGLEHVIEKMVNDTSSFQIEDYYVNFAKINFMIAVPDQTDIAINITDFEHLHNNFKCVHYQYMMQLEIKNTLNIDIPKLDESQIGDLNLTTLAEQRRCLVKPALKNIFRRLLGSMYSQFMMQLEIRDLLTGEARDLGGLNLTTLAEQRRVTGRSLGNKIRRVLKTDTSEVAKYQNLLDVSLLRMCRLIGLYISTQIPTSFIKKLMIDPINDTCTLYDGITQKKYKKINGVVWQISPTT